MSKAIAILQACMEDALILLEGQEDQDLPPSLRSNKNCNNQLMETGEKLADDDETEERSGLRAMSETQTGTGSQPVAKRRRLDSEADPPDVLPDAAVDSELDVEDIPKERDAKWLREQLNRLNGFLHNQNLGNSKE